MLQPPFFYRKLELGGCFIYAGMTTGAVMFAVTQIYMTLSTLIVRLNSYFVSFIQAYVFTILVYIYIKDTKDLHYNIKHNSVK